MSWDPNSQQGQPPSGPNPYNQQPPYSQPSYNPYEQPSGQPPYGVPPTGYGAPGYQQGAFGYAPQGPRPLGQAIQELPSQYVKVLTKPGAQSFAEEQGKAGWGIIWLQLLFVGLIGTIIGLIRVVLGSAFVMSTAGGANATAFAVLSSVFVGGASVFSIIAVIIGFFIIVGIQYLLAKAFGGNGDFTQQAYSYLLFYVPITLVSNVLGLIPILGGIIGFALGIYQIILNVFSIMAAHRLSGGKATMVVLIPIIAIILLVLLCAVALAAIFVSAINGAAQP